MWQATPHTAVRSVLRVERDSDKTVQDKKPKVMMSYNNTYNYNFAKQSIIIKRSSKTKSTFNKYKYARFAVLDMTEPTEACSFDDSVLASTTTVDAAKIFSYAAWLKPESAENPNMFWSFRYKLNPVYTIYCGKYFVWFFRTACFVSEWNIIIQQIWKWVIDWCGHNVYYSWRFYLS